MVKVCDAVEVMERWAPSQIAESWDTVGLITGDPENELRTIIIALETTENTLAIARHNKPSLVIAHHPPFLKPLKHLSGGSLTTSILCTALKDDIALYISHTNLDQAPGGVSHALAEKFGLVEVSPLAPGNSGMVKFVTFAPPEYIDTIRRAAGSAGAGIIGEYSFCSFTSEGTGTYIPSSAASPYEGKSGELSQIHESRLEMITPSYTVPLVVSAARKAHPYEEMAYDIIPLGQKDRRFGYGVIGELKEPMETKLFFDHIASSLGIGTLTVSQCGKTSVKRVAVMGGGGKDYIGCALSSGADAFITGDIGYHAFLEYGDRFLLVDATHWATELPVISAIEKRLTMCPKLKDITILLDRGAPSFTTHTCSTHG